MSVPASQSPARPARRRRRARIAAGAVLLVLVTTACSSLGRTSVGTVTYSIGADTYVKLTSPKVRGCHRLPPSGTTELYNNTLVDMVMYRTPDCTGKDTTYIGSRLANNTAPKAAPWRSYSFVH
uniref:Lipoprotein n=1 Tax=Streptomyces sp. NBC_00003 TaxID=2903608 RepID=A0AAU2VB08_9ACTN